MKLINPGTGEICDRLTILALKITHGTEAGKDVAHFEAERAALLTKIHTRTLNGPWFGATLELAAVNARIWHAEDQLRDFRGGRAGGPAGAGAYTPGDLETIRILAFRLQALNDHRAELVATINKEAGDGLTKEK